MSRSRIVGGERMKRMSYILNSHDSIEDIRRRLLGLQLDREAVSLTLVPIRVLSPATVQPFNVQPFTATIGPHRLLVQNFFFKLNGSTALLALGTTPHSHIAS